MIITIWHIFPTPLGSSCRVGGRTYCHGDVTQSLGRLFSRVCDNGTAELMKVPADYKGQAKCRYRGNQYCLDS